MCNKWLDWTEERIKSSYVIYSELRCVYSWTVDDKYSSMLGTMRQNSKYNSQRKWFHSTCNWTSFYWFYYQIWQISPIWYKCVNSICPSCGQQLLLCVEFMYFSMQPLAVRAVYQLHLMIIATLCLFLHWLYCLSKFLSLWETGYWQYACISATSIGFKNCSCQNVLERELCFAWIR